MGSETDSTFGRAPEWPWGSPGSDFELLQTGRFVLLRYSQPRPRRVCVQIDQGVLSTNYEALLRTAEEVTGLSGPEALGSWLLYLLYEALDIHEADNLLLEFDGEDFKPTV